MRLPLPRPLRSSSGFLRVQRRVFRLALLFGCFLAWAPLGLAIRNPLNVVLAVESDDRSPGIRNESPVTLPAATMSLMAANPAAVPYLANVHDGNFALYRACDFDSGVAAFRATVAGLRPGLLELHLDSPTGPLLVACPFAASGGWGQWQDVTANVDNSQAGVRDVHVLFRAPAGEPASPRALVNFRSFVFLKSVVTPSTGGPDLTSRIDSTDEQPAQDNSILSQRREGFLEEFNDDGWRARWKNPGDLQRAQVHISNPHSIETTGVQPLFTYTPDSFLNPTDTGGDWRTLSEGSFTATLTPHSASSRPGVGFASKDGKRAVYVTLDPEAGSLTAWRKLADGTVTRIRSHAKLSDDPLPATDPPGRWPITPGQPYRLRVDWSPYSNALIACLSDASGNFITNFRTVVDLPAARCPLLVNSDGAASFANLLFDPALDAWNYRWEWLKQPILSPDVCNPAVWRGPNGQMYMMWRKFGADTFHGIAKSDDGIHWNRVTDQAIKCTGDMIVLPDPFGDGKWYATPGGNDLPWWTSDGSDDFKTWTKTNLTIGDIHEHSRIQEIIDTKRYPQLKPVRFDGQDYRFIAYCEDWVHAPQPHTVVLLSNTLTDWVQPTTEPVIPPSNDFWGEKGNAIGSAIPLPDGNILISSCSCTNEGYTGASEPTNITAIASGTEPWKILKKAVLPDAPVSRENVWYQGPNFGTAFFYADKSDTLFYYGGFHDYHIGMMRVRHFLHPDPVPALSP